MPASRLSELGGQAREKYDGAIDWLRGASADATAELKKDVHDAVVEIEEKVGALRDEVRGELAPESRPTVLSEVIALLEVEIAEVERRLATVAAELRQQLKDTLTRLRDELAELGSQLASAHTASSAATAPLATPLATSLAAPLTTAGHLGAASTAVAALPAAATAAATALAPAASTGALGEPHRYGVFQILLFLLLVLVTGFVAFYAAVGAQRLLVRLWLFATNFSYVWFGTASSFSQDTELGLSSESFSLTANVEGADGRRGLDRDAKLRILWYIFLYGESFDEARLRLVKYQFAQNGISPEGLPLDPKLVR